MNSGRRVEVLKRCKLDAEDLVKEELSIHRGCLKGEVQTGIRQTEKISVRTKANSVADSHKPNSQ